MQKIIFVIEKIKKYRKYPALKFIQQHDRSHRAIDTSWRIEKQI